MPTDEQKPPASLADEFVAVGDLVLGFPAFLASLGARGSAAIGATVAGIKDPLQASSQFTQQAMSYPWMQALSSPLSWATERDTRGTVVHDAMSIIAEPVERFAKYVGEQTGSAEMAEGARQGGEVVLAYAPVVGVNLAAKALRARIEGKKAASVDMFDTAAEIAQVAETAKAAAETAPLNKQAGAADVEFLAKVGGTAGGAALGAVLDPNEVRGALIGGLAGFTAGHSYKASITNFKRKAREIAETEGEAAAFNFMEARLQLEAVKNRVREVELLTQRELNSNMASVRMVDSMMKKTKERVPNPAAREAIFTAMDTKTVDALPADLKPVAQSYRKLFDAKLVELQEAGIKVESMVEEYVSHIVDTGRSPNFFKERKYETAGDLEAAGFKLATKDIAEVYAIYSMAVDRAIMKQNVVRSVESQELIKPLFEAPRDWKTLNSAYLRGKAVHPEVAHQMSFVFQSADLGVLMNGVHTLSQSIKRVNVMGSLFHAKSLVEAAVLALGPVEAARAMGSPKGINATLDIVRSGKAGDLVDSAIRNGVTYEVPSDITMGVLESSGRVADTILGKFGLKTEAMAKTGAAIEKVTLTPFDKITWDHLYTGLKFYTYQSLLEKAKRNHPLVPEEVLGREIAPFVNSTYGGQNWFELATSFQSEVGRALALDALSPKGRKVGQSFLFALDWSTSAWRSLSMSFPKMLGGTGGTGLKGLTKPLMAADYARRYQIRNALMYMTLINAINLKTAGHPLWENKDPTRIEFRDGTSMQPMKHAAEPYHWVMDFGKTLRNKLAAPPKVLLETVDTGFAGRKTAGERVANVAGMISPFSVRSAVTAPTGESVKRAVAGTLGFPIYGKPKGDKMSLNYDLKLDQ